MEPFMEYLAAEHFKSRGYIVESQIPLAHSLGSPDFGGYALHETFQSLSKYGLFESGFHIIELSLIRIYPPSNHISMTRPDYTIVGEAKTSSTSMLTQLTKYMDTGLFAEGYEIHPSKKSPSKNHFGLVTLSKDWRLRVVRPLSNYTYPGATYSKSDYCAWLNNYMKFYTIANLTNDELKQYMLSKFGRMADSQEDLASLITKQSLEEILDYLITKIAG